MANKTGKGKQISRRGILPILGGSLLLPFIGFGNNIIDETITSQKDEYETLLRPDGTTVKVKVSTLKKATVIKKKMSNKSLLKWLGKKL